MWPVPHSNEHARPFHSPVFIYHTWNCLPAPVQIDVCLGDTALLAWPKFIFHKIYNLQRSKHYHEMAGAWAEPPQNIANERVDLS
jgi:hypothetical protein